MADQNQNPQWFQPKGRPVGGTEHSWCRAVSGGTGITVLALQFTKPLNISLLQNAIHKLQNSHPILLSKLFHNNTTNTFSFTTPTPTTTPPLQIKSFNLSSTTHLLRNLSTTTSLSPLHIILEHELNNNVWANNPSNLSCTGIDLFFASLYALPDTKWVVVLRLHTVVCDLTTAVGLLRELKGLMTEGEGGGGTQIEMVSGGEVSLGIEDLIPSGKAKKPTWAHGLDMLSYSLNSLRSTNLKFEDVKGARCSKVVRLQLSACETDKILNFDNGGNRKVHHLVTAWMQYLDALPQQLLTGKNKHSNLNLNLELHLAFFQHLQSSWLSRNLPALSSLNL